MVYITVVLATLAHQPSGSSGEDEAWSSPPPCESRRQERLGDQETERLLINKLYTSNSGKIYINKIDLKINKIK